MTTFQIRLIAIITMVIDHVGLFFFPHLVILRIIGRLSFPLFAWLIANGAKYSHNNTLYLKRLLVLAVLSQAPFIACNLIIGSSFWYFNVVFTLALGLASILLIKKTKNIFWQVYIIAFATLLAYFFNFDYAIVGILSIVCFYFFSESPRRLLVSQVAIFSVPLILNTALSSYFNNSSYSALDGFKSLGGLLVSLLLIHLYNNKEGLKAKNLFYLFYPLQYVAILILLLLLK